MSELQKLFDTYRKIGCRDLNANQLTALSLGLKNIASDEVQSVEDGKKYIALLRKFREAVAENDKFHGTNYPTLLNSLLSVGEDGLYSNNLRFIFELIQNVDDCVFPNSDDCKLDMHFDFNTNRLTLNYNEVGFTPFNVFAITGIAEAAKNVTATKNEIGEKGIGFKSVFGVAKRVLIQSGWFSFELVKDNFTIPIASYQNKNYCNGTQMTLFLSVGARGIYRQIRDQYCRKEALFSKNPLLFLNKLTSLRIYYDSWRSMVFKVSRTTVPDETKIYREDDVKLSVNLRDYDNCIDRETVEEITCTRYLYPVTYSKSACQSRYGKDTLVGSNGGKKMLLQAVVPYVEDVSKVGNGGLYSFLPTQLAFTVPIVCHAPFKLDASREFVDPQDKERKGNQWFCDTSQYLSELMDYVFLDWAKTVKENIVYYVPAYSNSLIAKNNGKEECLSNQVAFKGKHYLDFPLFVTTNGDFKPAHEMFYFEPTEGIAEQNRVTMLLGLSKSLFIAPENSSAIRFGIAIEKNVYHRLFYRALRVPSVTEEILNYLEAVGYEYSEKQFPKKEELSFDATQAECIFHHSRLYRILCRVANEAIKANTRSLFSITGGTEQSITDVLYQGFELSETPRIVERYMHYCKGVCVCLDIDENRYLPCHNSIILSKHNALASFAAFCYDMDSRDTFAIRIKLREASNQLNQCVENNTGSAADYIRDLRNIRLTVKDSLGEMGYKNYLDLILKSGTDRTRFIQELLQNADDCIYPEGRTPSFTLYQQGNKIITEYNEAGFTRENIRSITAIGESTKNRLLSGDFRSIGEKGVGFKTVFAIASNVKVYSGEYNFELTSVTPTIPRLLSSLQESVIGTRMEIALKDRLNIPGFKVNDVLELCLCLRRLQKLDINGNRITITDSNTKRTIVINGRSFVFYKYIHSFFVYDPKALEERKNGSRMVDKNQQIICYVPNKSSTTDYPLYNGLPTKHRTRIPMAIDAPFELTTSREEIEVDCALWNDRIKTEVYNAIIKVIHVRKHTDKANALRFARFAYRLRGNQSTYENDVFDLAYLNSYNYLARLSSEKVLPTFDDSTFVSVSQRTAYRYPEVATLLLGRLAQSEYGGLHPETIINPATTGVSKEQKERIEAIFNALACENVPFNQVFPLIQKYVESFIDAEDFRSHLYEYLQSTPTDYQEKLLKLKMIPVYGRIGGTQYISWMDNEIFVKKNAVASDKAYWILNENYLSKSMCEKMLGININEMTVEWERNRYRSNLQAIIRGNDLHRIYSFLLAEFNSGALRRNDCLGVLLEHKEMIPLKNELGEITKNNLYICRQPTGYFDVDMLKQIIVHKECTALAEYMKCCSLADIYHEDIDYHESLTDEDVEALQDEEFIHSEEILRGFYRDGYLSDELLERYDLEYLGMGKANDTYNGYEFPEKPVRDRKQLIQHILALLKKPVKIFSVKVERTVLKGCQNGQTISLEGKDTRGRTLQIYTPEGVKQFAFCQMCLKLKPYMLMEVNNLELHPNYYFPETRMALCLECSKRFEALRWREKIRKEYLEAIRTKNIGYEGKVEIPIGREDTITFTATHLAEIQELLKRMPE